MEKIYMNYDFRPKADSAKFVIQELPDELLLYNLDTNRAFALNHTSGFVWQNCTGEKSVREIAQDLENQLHKNVPEDLIWLTLERLQSENLIEIEDQSLIRELKVNRRKMLKSAGLATLVALPLISSMIAPQSVNAQSGIILQQCSACLKRQNDQVFCDTVCEDIILGHCHDNSGCGEGLQAPVFSTCQECFAGATPAGNASTLSWHGLSYK